MGAPNAKWVERHPGRGTGLIVLLLIVVAAETFFLFQQHKVDKARSAESDRLLATFLSRDTALTAAGSSVHIRLQNVRFKWSDKVYIDAGNMAVRAVPVRGTTVDFDDLDSFRLVVQKSVVVIRPDVLAGMFNESIFNYPQSRVRQLVVSIEKDDQGAREVLLSGKVLIGVWVPFTMYTHLSVDPATHALVIDVDHLKAFGIIPVTKLIRWTPMHLDRLIALPPNKSLLVDGNRMLVKPLGMFPPPRIIGEIASIDVGDSSIRIVFAGDAIPAPASSATNYVYMRGGASRFGRFLMTDTDVLVLDQHPSDPFSFSLLRYAQLLAKSKVELPDTRSVRVTMPDD